MRSKEREEAAAAAATAELCHDVLDLGPSAVGGSGVAKMAKSNVVWTLVISLVILNQLVYARPSSEANSSLPNSDKGTSTETSNRIAENKDKYSLLQLSTSQPRDVKTKVGPIGESIKMVASQLLENINNASDTTIVADTRIPPKLKNQLPLKNKLKTRLEDSDSTTEKSHAGVAVPVSLEEIETESVINSTHESSTTQGGISTWILLSNPTSKDNYASTEPTKVEEVHKKNKPGNKNKKKPSGDNKVPASRHPLIGSINKSDLIAGGSALNDNVLNKIKDTVLSNVQKNKSTASPKSTTEATATSITHVNEASILKKEPINKGTVIPVVKVSAKPTKKKSNTKTKPKTTSTTEATPANESAMLPMEPKEQEIELEISTPATTTKKPKRTSSKKKKTKTKKRKASTPKPVSQTALELKASSNKTKSAKPAKTAESPITTQIYNYLSREVMPSVGVGVIGLAGLVGLASYFFYPFATPVRRTFEVDKKDDLYRHNGEEYASEGNGQAEEEMLGTVLAGMPAHSKNRLNPYMGQTMHNTGYSSKKEQDLRYRHVASNYDAPNYNVHYPQQKTGIAHGAAYADHINYTPQHIKNDNRFIYTTEGKYAYEKSSYTPYASVEPIYAAPSEPTGSGYGIEEANSVVYGVKPSGESDFKPVYPFEGQVFSDTTSDPVTYPPTSMYLGSNNESEQGNEYKSSIENKSDRSSDFSDLSKFVVGNVPKDFVDTVTPAIVPEHGPRNLNRKKRLARRIKRNIVETIENVLKESKSNGKDIFLSNEIDEVLDVYAKKTEKNIEENLEINPLKNSDEVKYTIPINKEVIVLSHSVNDGQFVESVSTLPVDKTEETIPQLEKLNEVYPIALQTDETNKTIPATGEGAQMNEESVTFVAEKSTEAAKSITETTTEISAVPSSTILPTMSPYSLETKIPDVVSSTTHRPKPTNPNIITYPPIGEEGSFFTFLKRLLDFKYRLGLSILQTTSDSLNRYLGNVETAVNNVTPASTVKQ